MRFHTRILFAMIVTGGALLLGTIRLDAQEIRYGFAAGLSFAEGLKGPAPVPGPFLLPGAIDPGYHLRGSLESNHRGGEQATTPCRIPSRFPLPHRTSNIDWHIQHVGALPGAGAGDPGRRDEDYFRTLGSRSSGARASGPPTGTGSRRWP